MGVAIYKMLNGKTPFQHWNYDKIVDNVSRDIQFPEFFTLKSKDLLSKLLEPKEAWWMGSGENSV